MWRRLARNALANVAGTAVGLAVGFVTMPLVVHHLGPTEFGLWVLATGIAGWVGVLDLGLSPTLVTETAGLMARADPALRERVSETASTIYALYALLGVLAALGLAAVGWAAGALFRVPAGDLGLFRLVLLVLGLQTALALPMSVWNGLLSATEAFHVLNALGVATTSLRAALTIALVLSGHGLAALVAASLGVTALGWAASRWCVLRRLPWLRVRLRGFRRARLPAIGRVSAAMVVWAAAGAALHQLDRVLIGVCLPVRMLTTYEVGARLASYSRNVLHSWLAIVLPATSALAARGERRRLGALCLRATRHLMASYAGVAVLLLGLGGPFVRLWMGEGFEESVVVMRLLVLASVVQSQNVVAHVMLPGMGELGVFTRFMAVYPVVTAICAVAGILQGGLVGLAAGMAAAVVVMETAFLLIVRGRFGVPLRRLVARCHLPVAKATAPAVAWVALVRALDPLDGWLALGMAGASTAAVFAASLWMVGVTAGERRVLRASLAGLVRTAGGGRLSRQPSC